MSFVNFWRRRLVNGHVFFSRPIVAMTMLSDEAFMMQIVSLWWHSHRFVVEWQKLPVLIHGIALPKYAPFPHLAIPPTPVGYAVVHRNEIAAWWERSVVTHIVWREPRYFRRRIGSRHLNMARTRRMHPPIVWPSLKPFISKLDWAMEPWVARIGGELLDFSGMPRNRGRGRG